MTTPLPAKNLLDGTKSPATTTGEMRAALGQLRDYLNDLLGSSGGANQMLLRLGAWFWPRAQTTPNMTVHVSAGSILNGVTLTEVAAQNTANIAAPTANPRIDRVVVNALTGTVSVVAGTEAGSPTAPAIPTGNLPVCRVALVVGQTSILDANITDERNINAAKQSSQITDFSNAAGTTTGLTYGYNAGTIRSAATTVGVAAGTIALAANTTNHVEVSGAGVVSVNSTGFTAGRFPMATVLTGASTITTITDRRGFPAVGAAIGVTAGTAQQVNQATTSTATAATVVLGTTLKHLLTGTTAVTAFNGVADVTYNCRAGGAFLLTHHATNLIITQTGANITTAANDTFDVHMTASGTCRIINFIRASGAAVLPTATALASATTTVNVSAATAPSANQVLTATSSTAATWQTPAVPTNIVMGTPISPAGVQTASFTGIPSDVKRIVISFAGISTTSSADIEITLGDAGGLETTGYLGATAGLQNATAISAGNRATCFVISVIAVADTLHGSLTLTLLNSATNTWAASGSFARSNTAACVVTCGSKSLSAVLDRILIDAVAGNTFDAGTINIQYES